ncbi:RNA polymerase-binding protein RbpA, partial [Actinotignum timonense]|nr:RNA polymerase-binding protein RbpA [Actinotignum timonense]
MAERSLRGMRIGANSLETDDNVVFVDRQQVKYRCKNGHEFGVAMASATIWNCGPLMKPAQVMAWPAE